MTETKVSQRTEYHDIFDKTDWGFGEWRNEPDKVTWVDEQTGYPCIILRGPVAGALNGYIGVPIYHPAYGLSYDGCTQQDHDQRSDAYRKAITNIKNDSKGRPIFEQINFGNLPETPVVPDIGDKIRDLRVHGGLTFSGGPSIPTKEIWESHKKYAEKAKLQALIYPHGDAAEFMKEWGPVLNNYKAWAKQSILRGIGLGHINDENWYFGFDCSHAFDLCPKIEAFSKAVGYRPLGMTPELPSHMRDVYRNIKYVENECKLLAEQVKTTCIRPRSLAGQSN